eukprot:12892083-Prorocentrum_lima.AAC.1
MVDGTQPGSPRTCISNTRAHCKDSSQALVSTWCFPRDNGEFLSNQLPLPRVICVTTDTLTQWRESLRCRWPC